MTREDEIVAIIRRGRVTRTGHPRWLWIVSAIVGVVCSAGFAVAMLADRAPPPAGPEAHDPRAAHAPARSGLGSQLGIGLAIGGTALAIGVAIARQRRNHSSRNNP